jgi:hypothetical protein
MRLTYRLEKPAVRKLLQKKQAVQQFPNPSMEVTDGEMADLRLEAESVVHEVADMEEALRSVRNSSSSSSNANTESIAMFTNSNTNTNTNTNEEDPNIRIANANVINRYMPNGMRNNVLTSKPIHEGNAMVQLNNHANHVFAQPSIRKWWRTQRKQHKQINNPLTRNPIRNIGQVKRFTAKWKPSSV